MKKIFYMCDGKNEICGENKNCFRNGGNCFKTENIEHAINFIDRKGYYAERATKINVPELFSTGTINIRDL